MSIEEATEVHYQGMLKSGLEASLFEKRKSFRVGRQIAGSTTVSQALGAFLDGVAYA